MKKNIILFFVFFVAAFAMIVAAVYFLSSSKYASDKDTYVVELNDQQLFLPELLYADFEAANSEAGSAENILAGIGPHHLPYGAGCLKSLYHALSADADRIQTILLLGPNHFERGEGDLITAEVEYQTSLGRVESDAALVVKLVDSGFVLDDSKPFSEEHAIYAHIPFIQTYLPQARVVPLLFRSELRLQEAHDFGQWLAANLDDSVVVVLSSDFSHYQPVELARWEDEQTVRQLQTVAVTDLENLYLDAKPAAVSLMTYLQAKGSTSGVVLQQGNSADFGADPTNTTSYAAIIY